MDHGEKLAIVTSLSERIAATTAAVPRGEARPSRDDDAAPTDAVNRDGFDRISNVAMSALTRRGMSSAELRSYLAQREFAAAAVDDEIDRLESVGLLDDLQLAEVLIDRFRQRKGLGRAALRAELGRRRLDPDAIAAALEAVDDDEAAMAQELAHKRAAQLRGYDRETAMRRLVSFLQRKGYSSGIAARAAQTALGDQSRTGTGPTFQ